MAMSALVQVISVTRPDTPLLLAASIEVPRPAAENDVHALDIGGWVLGSNGKRVVAVAAVFDDLPLRRVPAHLPRKDVAKAYPESPDTDKCGFHMTVGLLGLPMEFTIRLSAVFEDDTAAPLAVIKGQRQPVDTQQRHTPRMRPIIVTNLGRSGSTLLMRLLAEHPQIVAHRLHPFETRAAGYWMHMAQVLSQPANHLQSSHPNNYQHNAFFAGHHPHYMSPVVEPRSLLRWFGKTYIEDLAAFAQRSSEGFYHELATAQGRAGAEYFVEKHHPNHTPRLVWELYPRARELFLVRDFRDMVGSMLGWYRKLGLVSFGRENFKSDAEFVRRKRHLAQRILRTWQSRRDKALLVRYEDLILRPVQTMGRVLEYLQLGDSAADAIAGMFHRASADSAEFRSHRTTDDVRKSIGRWRETDEELRAVCRETFDDLLPDFGYELDANGDLVLPDAQPLPPPPDPDWSHLPETSTVVLVSKGDHENQGRPPQRDRGRLWFFPCDEGGAFTGHYPADSAEAIAHLEKLRGAGADYLVFPSTSLWWLDSYPQFREHLEQRYGDPGVSEAGRDVRIYRLRETPRVAAPVA